MPPPSRKTLLRTFAVVVFKWSADRHNDTFGEVRNTVQASEAEIAIAAQCDANTDLQVRFHELLNLVTTPADLQPFYVARRVTADTILTRLATSEVMRGAFQTHILRIQLNAQHVAPPAAAAGALGAPPQPPAAMNHVAPLGGGAPGQVAVGGAGAAVGAGAAGVGAAGAVGAAAGAAGVAGAANAAAGVAAAGVVAGQGVAGVAGQGVAGAAGQGVAGAAGQGVAGVAAGQGVAGVAGPGAGGAIPQGWPPGWQAPHHQPQQQPNQPGFIHPQLQPPVQPALAQHEAHLAYQLRGLIQDPELLAAVDGRFLHTEDVMTKLNLLMVIVNHNYQHQLPLAAEIYSMLVSWMGAAHQAAPPMVQAAAPIAGKDKTVRSYVEFLTANNTSWRPGTPIKALVEGGISVINFADFRYVGASLNFPYSKAEDMATAIQIVSDLCGTTMAAKKIDTASFKQLLSMVTLKIHSTAQQLTRTGHAILLSRVYKSIGDHVVQRFADLQTLAMRAEPQEVVTCDVPVELLGLSTAITSTVNILKLLPGLTEQALARGAGQPDTGRGTKRKAEHPLLLLDRPPPVPHRRGNDKPVGPLLKTACGSKNEPCINFLRAGINGVAAPCAASCTRKHFKPTDVMYQMALAWSGLPIA